jgi:hypothetical protein
MPFAYNSVCYVDENAALAAFEQAFTPITTVVNGTPYQWILNNRVVDALGEISYDLIRADYANPADLITQFYYLPSCDMADPTANFMLGHELGWAVGSVMILTYVVRRIYRG